MRQMLRLLDDWRSSRAIQGVLAEYAAMRNEIDTAGRNLYSVSWQGGLALVGVLAAGAAALENNFIAALIFGAGGPAVGAYFVWLWAEEVFRLVRAADYIRDFIEFKANALLGTPRRLHELPQPQFARETLRRPLAWEDFLVSLSKGEGYGALRCFQRFHLRLTPFPLLCAGLASSTASAHIVVSNWNNCWVWPVIVGACASLVWVILVWLKVFRIMKKHY